MRDARLALAFPEPPAGRLLILGADAGRDLSGLDPETTLIVEGMAQDHAALEGRGFRVATSAGDDEDAFDTVLVTLPRARAAARARIADGAARLAPGGAMWIDGQKTDGIESIIKEIKRFSDIPEIHSKAHGKIARLADPAAIPADWAARPISPAPGFVTLPGMFSAESVDPGSAALAAALPEKLPSRIVDLGAGWGWLSAQILTRPGVAVLHLVEADHAALECARANVTDPRARFHWADARSFNLPEPVNGVVMNPPFHQSRAADPGLGLAFIRAAASLLTGAGRLWMVANRHLPYEAELARHFADVRETGGDGRFKILAATGTGVEIGDLRSDEGRAFGDALGGVMLDLAQQVVMDGEGATKFVEVRVTGAADAADAHKVAMAIANSPLVKTAIAGEDANWGRVVMAVGKSGAQADRDRLTIRFGDMVLAENGWRAPSYDEAEASAYMTRDRLVLGVDLGLGTASRTVWTCDLTHGYIDINADYRS